MKEQKTKKKLNQTNHIPPNQPINSPKIKIEKKTKNKENKETIQNI
jgi:hypothetical protein